VGSIPTRSRQISLVNQSKISKITVSEPSVNRVKNYSQKIITLREKPAAICDHPISSADIPFCDGWRIANV